MSVTSEFPCLALHSLTCSYLSSMLLPASCHCLSFWLVTLLPVPHHWLPFFVISSIFTLKDYFKDRQPCWPLNRGLGATRHLSYPSESWVEKEHSSQKDDSGSPEGPQFCLWFGVKLGPRITSQCQLQKPLLAYCLPQRDTPSEYSVACSSLPCWHGIELSWKPQLNGLRTGCTFFASTDHLHMKYHKVTEILLFRFHIILLL